MRACARVYTLLCICIWALTCVRACVRAYLRVCVRASMRASFSRADTRLCVWGRLKLNSGGMASLRVKWRCLGRKEVESVGLGRSGVVKMPVVDSGAGIGPKYNLYFHPYHLFLAH